MDYFIDNIVLILFFVYALCLIGFGIILLTKKKIMVKNNTAKILILLMVLGWVIEDIYNDNLFSMDLIMYAVFLIIAGVAIRYGNKKYYIYNMDYDVVVDDFNKYVQTSELDVDATAITKKYGKNCCEVNMKDYRKDKDLCNEIKTVFQEVLKNQESKYLANDWWYNILLGGVAIAYIIYKLSV